MKGLGLLVSLLITGIAAVWYVPAIIWGYQITKESQNIGESGGTKMAELMKGPAPVRWFRNRNQMKGYYSLEDLTPYRTVAHSFIVPFESLLAPGEPVPGEEYHALYAMARAPALLASKCPEILGTLASKCDVGESKGELLRDGFVKIWGQLDYIPAYDIGDPSAVKNAKIMWGASIIVDRREKADTPENRAEAYKRSLLLCDRVREKFGNCLIEKLRFREDLHDGVETFSLMATLAVNADQTIYQPDDVRAEIDRMAESLLN